MILRACPTSGTRKLELTKNYFSAYLFRGGNESGLWSTRGCKLDDSASNGTHSVCRCNHLTNFAILMKVKSDTTEVKEVTFHIIKTAYTWTFCSPPHKIFMRAKQRKEMPERGAGKERLSLAYRPALLIARVFSRDFLLSSLEMLNLLAGCNFYCLFPGRCGDLKNVQYNIASTKIPSSKITWIPA